MNPRGEKFPKTGTMQDALRTGATHSMDQRSPEVSGTEEHDARYLGIGAEDGMHVGDQLTERLPA